MEKGLLILTLIIVLVLSLNAFAIRIFKLPKHKRERVRKVSWIVYSLLFLGIGVLFMSSGDSYFSGYFYNIVGLGYLAVNWLEHRKKPL
tara:strand:- start:369 stop:635 length:267 start_codon:yes stop_codon:yes gene_type:complete